VLGGDAGQLGLGVRDLDVGEVGGVERSDVLAALVFGGTAVALRPV